MNITQEADYALRVIAYLSELDEDSRESASSIAEKLNIPPRFLLKILRKLRENNLIQSFMGVKGGYILAKKPEDITLKDVIASIDGPIYINRCLYDSKLCNRYPINCNVHNAMVGIQQSLVENLESINFKMIKEQY